MSRPGVWMLIAMALAAGCSNDANKTPVWQGSVAKRPAVPQKKGPSVEEQTAGMVTAASPGKSDVPIGLKFEIDERPIVGRPLAIDIALLPRLAANSGTLEVTDSAGIDVTGTGVVDIPAIESDQVYRTRLSVTPNREGVLYLGLSVTVHHEETSESRIFTVPLIATTAAAIPSAAAGAVPGTAADTAGAHLASSGAR